MIHFLGTLFSFLLVLGIIVLVHEFGHYLAARLVGIRVDVFSFGFGKRLFGRRIGATDFRVSLFPLGGYVRLAGEEDGEEPVQRDEMRAKNRAQKILTYIMGPAMNLLLALALLTILQMKGVPTPAYKLEAPRVGYVEKGSPAAAAGIRKGDRLLAIGHRAVATWKDVETLVGINPGERLSVQFERDGRRQTTTLEVSRSGGSFEIGLSGFLYGLPAEIGSVEPGLPAETAGLRPGDRIVAIDGQATDNFFEVEEIIRGAPDRPLRLQLESGGAARTATVTPKRLDNSGVIGIRVRIPAVTVRYGLGAALREGWREAGRLAMLTLDAFKKMIRGKLSPRQLSGPIEIAKFSKQAMQSGFGDFILLLAFISLQLGLVNLFPIPGLDGGQLLVLLIESLIRRDLNPRLKNGLVYIGFSLLLMLMLFVVLNDIAKALPHGWKSLLPFLH